MAFYRGSGSSETIACGSAADVVFGTKGNDSISGGLGADVISGGAGNDTVDGGAGNDVIFGAAGNDVITGGDGNDAMSGGDGNDTFEFGDDSGEDTVDGEAGTDVMDFSDMTGSTGITVAVAGSNVMEMSVGTTALGEAYDIEKLVGGDNATIDGGTDDDGFTVDLSKALQTVSGLLSLKNLSGFDNVTGGDGDDSITGSTGNNVIDGGAGDDTVNASAGSDEYEGGADDDTLSFAAKSFTNTSGLTFDLSEGELTYSTVTVTASGFEYIVGSKSKADILDGSGITGSGAGLVIDLSTTTGSADLGVAATAVQDTAGIIGFEIVYGSDKNDEVTGDSAANTMEGNGGDDTLSGGTGNDLFTEGADATGSDEINGGVGTDKVDYGTNAGVYTFDLGAGTVDTGDEVDTLTGIETLELDGSQAGDILDASDATAALTITLATGKISGLAANATNALKTVSGFEFAIGGSGGDKISAGDSSAAAKANDIDGSGGADSLDGGFGADTLDGGAGADTLVGGAGDDILYGGADADKMTDKLGNDTYSPLNDEATVAAAFGTDTISDLAGTDELDLSLWAANDVTFDIVDGSTDKDTNKLDALKITTDNGVVIIDGYFNNTVTVDNGLEDADVVVGAGCIESIIIGSTTFDFADIKDIIATA